MGTENFRKHHLEYTTGAVLWQLKEFDDFSVKRITLTFDDFLATIENIKIWHKSGDNTVFDCVIRNVDPNGMKYISFECIDGFENGDHVLVDYANSDGVGIRGMAILEI